MLKRISRKKEDEEKNGIALHYYTKQESAGEDRRHNKMTIYIYIYKYVTIE